MVDRHQQNDKTAGTTSALCALQSPHRRLNKGYLYNNRFALCVCQITDAILRLLPLRKRRCPKNPTSILLIKPDHMGDMFLMGSVLPLLKRRYPDCPIDLVAGTWARPVAAGLSHIRDIYWVDHWMHNRSVAPLWEKLFFFLNSAWSALRSIRRRHYDICLCLRSFGGNLIGLGALSGAQFLAGHGTGGLGPLLDAQASWQEGAHETEHFLEVLALCDVFPNSDTHLTYPALNDANSGRWDNERRSLGIPDVYSVIAPCSGNAERMFPPNYWRTLVEQQQDRHFVISVGPDESDAALAIGQGFKNISIKAGEIAIRNIPLFYGAAQHVHAVDSFSAHLAGASGAPCTIHCRPGGADMAQFGPLGTNVRCVQVTDEDVAALVAQKRKCASASENIS